MMASWLMTLPHGRVGASWETPEGEKRSVTEIEADEVGASLKFATAKVERATERSPGDRSQGRERQTERGGDFNDQPPF
jgi:single-strand DNA-binding protein